ncbi:MAG: hypothetical protein ABJF50_09390 [Paracoccaceae bacterium]
MNDNSVTIQPDFSRRTEVVDPDDHHLFISLGCVAENLNFTAQTRGWNVIPVTKSTDVEVMLESPALLEADLFHAIPLRQSTRSQSGDQPISASDIALLKAATEQVGVSVLLLTEP